jgi:hypothetical protein
VSGAGLRREANPRRRTSAAGGLFTWTGGPSAATMNAT